MKGTRKMIVDILQEDGFFTSPGMLYHEAKIRGYGGTQSNLLNVANRMVKEEKIKGRKRGMAQRVWYKLKEECSEDELEHFCLVTHGEQYA